MLGQIQIQNDKTGHTTIRVKWENGFGSTTISNAVKRTQNTQVTTIREIECKKME